MEIDFSSLCCAGFWSACSGEMLKKTSLCTSMSQTDLVDLLCASWCLNLSNVKATYCRNHRCAFMHKRFYTQKVLLTTLLDTDACTDRRFYAQTLLHTEPFTHRHSHTQTLSQDQPHSQKKHQLFTPELAFPRKGCNWTNQARNFTSSFDDRPSFRAKKVAAEDV